MFSKKSIKFAQIIFYNSEIFFIESVHIVPIQECLFGTWQIDGALTGQYILFVILFKCFDNTDEFNKYPIKSQLDYFSICYLKQLR